MTNYFHTAAPVTYSRMMDLGRLVDRNGLGTREFMRFQQEVAWIRETTSKIEFRHGGAVLKEGSTFTDYYGLGTSVEAAILAAENDADYYQIQPDSTLLLVVRTSITERPVLLDGSEETTRHNARYAVKQYKYIPDDWFIYDEGRMRSYLAAKTMDERFEVGLTRLKSKDIGNAITWSSENDPEANKKLREDFIKILDKGEATLPVEAAIAP